MHYDQFEVDFIAVGDGERSGDAIAMRYGTAVGGHYITIIDGGTKETGQKLVRLVRDTYRSDTVHFVVNTHPDADHSSGLSVVLEELRVGQLWMHQPWKYAADIQHLFVDSRLTASSLSNRLREALGAAHELDVIARRKGIPTYEPFQGSRIGAFQVLSPARQWYAEDLIPQFRCTPDPQTSTLQGLGFARPAQVITNAVNWARETLGYETLAEGGVTSAENESSVVLYGAIDGKKILFTGDVGISGLSRALDAAAAQDVTLNDLWIMQVPHHGSRRNVSPSILNRLMSKYAFVSAAAKSGTHPRRVVTNAFARRGATVYVTRGSNLRHHHNMGERPGYSAAVAVPFYDEVEAA